MISLKRYISISMITLFGACQVSVNEIPAVKDTAVLKTDSLRLQKVILVDSSALPIDEVTQTTDQQNVNTGITTPESLMQFAETLQGTPYVWASTDPKVGFDCSGFITYVFKHFHIDVPRSSVDFLNVGKTVPVEHARRGDFILFTGTDPMEKNIGHMGLVVSNTAGGLFFIHCTSGKAMSVTISPFNDQYQKRFVRISRIFKQNGS